MNIGRWLQLRREGRLSTMPLGMCVAMAAFGDESEIASFHEDGILCITVNGFRVISEHWTNDGYGNSNYRHDVHYEINDGSGNGTGNGSEYGFNRVGIGGSKRGNGTGNGMGLIGRQLFIGGSEEGDGEGNGLGANYCRNFVYSSGYIIQYLPTNIGDKR